MANNMNPTAANDLDFLTIRGVTSIPSTKSEFGEEEDREIWRPRVNAKHPGYDARVRLLPQGMDGLKNRTYPGVNVKFHHLYVNGVRREVKCRHSIPGFQRCPICDDIWARWREANKQFGKDDKRVKALLSMTARDEWFTNVLIREDDNHPENNGQVRVWRHSDAMDRQLRAPFDDSAEATDTQNGQAAQGGIRARKKQEKRRFFPHSPTDGVDFTVMATWDTAKKMPTYEGSDFDEASTPLANTPNEMVDIISRCHDLGKYLQGIPTEQEAATIIREFWEETEKRAAQNAADLEAQNPMATGQQAYGASQYMPSGNPNYAKPAVEPRTTKVDATAFLGGAMPQQQQPAQQQFVQQPSAPAQSAGDASLINYAAQAAQAALAMPETAPAASAPKVDLNDLPAGDDDGDDLPF